jgi:hypothetical protein
MCDLCAVLYIQVFVTPFRHKLNHNVGNLKRFNSLIVEIKTLEVSILRRQKIKLN